MGDVVNLPNRPCRLCGAAVPYELGYIYLPDLSNLDLISLCEPHHAFLYDALRAIEAQGEQLSLLDLGSVDPDG